MNRHPRMFVALVLLGVLLGLLAEPATTFGESPGMSSQPSGEPSPESSAAGQTSAAQDAQPDGIARTKAGHKHPFGGRSGEDVSAQELANEVNNPTSPLTVVQFRDIYLPWAKPSNGPLNSFQMQPVIPIGPYDRFPYVQLMKISMPFVNTNPKPGGETGMGDLTVFDLATVERSWGRLGAGPILVLPTATETSMGAGKVQLGPAVGVMYTKVENLTIGAILQNPVSFAGSANRGSVNQLIVSPTLTYNLKDGWFVGLSDYNWSFDWKGGGAAIIPVGLQVGKVIRIGKQPVSVSIEAGRTAARPGGVPDPGWIIGFEFTPIFNFHIGPEEKVPLRGKKE